MTGRGRPGDSSVDGFDVSTARKPNYHVKELRHRSSLASLVAFCLQSKLKERGKRQMQLDKQGTLLCELEKRLHHPETRASSAEVASLLADEFFEFGASGLVWSRQQVIDGLPQEQKTQPARELGSSNFAVHWLAEGVALVTYRGTRRTPSDGMVFHFLRSSIWKLINERWQMVFHQGTPVGSAN
jgi:hypothetical protein